MYKISLAKFFAVVIFAFGFLYIASENYSGVWNFGKPLSESEDKSKGNVKQHDSKVLAFVASNNERHTVKDDNVDKKRINDTVTYNEKDILTAAAKDCNFVQTLHDFDMISMADGKLLDVMTYKKEKRNKFLRSFPHPAPKNSVRPTIKPQVEQTGKKPSGILNNPNERIDRDQIYDNVKKEREKNLARGDDDILKIPEVQDEMMQKQFKIPNLIHFIWFGCHPLRIDHYMALIGSLRYQKPRLILFHCDCEPSGEYWNAFKAISGNILKIVKRTPPDDIWGRSIKVVEHKADVVRLQLMLEVGGMYMDTDSVVVKSLDEFRNKDLVLGQATSLSVANGIILANKYSWFIQRWYWEYKYFRDSEWGRNSVVTAWALSLYFPDKLHLERNTFCRPNYQELNLLYREMMDWSSNYIVHLYSRYRPRNDGKDERTLKELAVLNTTYGEIARHVIWGDMATRDITNWLETCNTTQILIE